MSPVLDRVSTHMDEIERPLMTPDEIMRLRPPKKERGGNQEKIIAPGDMLIFVSGHYPIYGTQMLYFFDPILRSRAEIPPPTKFYSIHDGGLSPQDPLPDWLCRRSQHRDHARTAVCRLRLAVALAQTHQSSNLHHPRAPLFSHPQVCLSAWI